MESSGDLSHNPVLDEEKKRALLEQWEKIQKEPAYEGDEKFRERVKEFRVPFGELPEETVVAMQRDLYGGELTDPEVAKEQAVYLEFLRKGREFLGKLPPEAREAYERIVKSGKPEAIEALLEVFMRRGIDLGGDTRKAIKRTVPFYEKQTGEKLKLPPGVRRVLMNPVKKPQTQ